jgi:protein-S-isoprenylcysteine O-methyltransferase Ste14
MVVVECAKQKGEVCMISILGTPTINKYLFYSGKLLGYCSWCLFVIQFFKSIRQISIPSYAEYVAYALFLTGLIIAGISMLNLGESTTLGLPTTNTQFKNQGLYKISRNPMYVGFGLLTIGSIIQTANLFVFLCSIISLYTYHLIILGEEKFLINRFGNVYAEYCKNVRRYF